MSREHGITVKRPSDAWAFETDNPLPNIPLIMRRVDGSGKITVQKSLLHGVDLEQIVPSIGPSLAAQLQDLKILTTADRHIAGARAHLLDYTATEDGEARRFKHALLKIDERLFSIVCRADVSEFGEIEPEFDQILQSVSIVR